MNYLIRAANKWICWWFISVERKDLEKLLQGTDRKEVIISHWGNILCPYSYMLSTFSIFSPFFPQYFLLYKQVCHILYGLIPILNVWNRRKALTVISFSVCWTCGSFYKKCWLAFGVKVIIKDWKVRNWSRYRIKEILLQVVRVSMKQTLAKQQGALGVNIHI